MQRQNQNTGRRVSNKIKVKKRVSRYQQPTTGKWIKGYTKTIHKYPRKYRTFRQINGITRYVEVTRIKGKEKIKILDLIYEGVLYIKQPEAFKKSFPSQPFMKKNLYKREMDAFEKLSQDYKERSFAIDFERYLTHPERYVIIKGGEKSTMNLGDFELFGHSHPYEYPSQRLPSAADLQGATLFKPEFIITYPQYAHDPEKEAEIYFFNIEDLQKYDAWKEKYKNAESNSESISEFEIQNELAKIRAKDPKAFAGVNINKRGLLDSEMGRQIYFEVTGVRIYPCDKGIMRVNIELLDDPRPEVAIIPRVSTESLKEWQGFKSPIYINEEKTRVLIAHEREKIERPYLKKKGVTLEDQLKASEAFLLYLNNKQKEDIMNRDVLKEESEKENKRYMVLAHRLEDQMLKDPNRPAFEVIKDKKI